MKIRLPRSIVFWTHLSLGVTVGFIVLVMSFTGAMLGYQRQIAAWIDDAPSVMVTPGAGRLPLNDVLARAAIKTADVSSLVMRADPTLPLTVGFIERGRVPVLLDPFTAAQIGVLKPGRSVAFFDGLRRWHQSLGARTGALREGAVAAEGAASLLFLLMILLGLYLWWPSPWTPATMRATMFFKRGVGGRARDFNWHNVLGLWCALPLFVIVLSAVFMAYRWPNLWLDRALGSPAERTAAATLMNAPAKQAPSTTAPSTTAPPPVPPLVRTLVKEGDASPSAIFARVAALHPAWRTITIGVPSTREANVQVAVAEGNTFRPDLRWTLFLDPVALTPLKVNNYATLSPSRRIRSWFRYLHTGEVFGVPGQTVATVVSLCVVLLAWTGMALAVRRFVRWRGLP